MRCAVLSKRLAVPKMTEKDFQVSDQVLVRYQLEMEVSSWAELNWEFHCPSPLVETMHFSARL